MENKNLQNIKKTIREEIKKIIYNMNENSEGDGSIAKEAIIALSKGQIPKNDIIEINGNLHGADFDDEGYTSSEGEVEMMWMFNGIEFSTIVYVVGSFYLIKGSSGRWGSSIDDSEAPEPDDHRSEKIELEDDSLIVGDKERNEYEFSFSELGSSFKEDLEGFLLNRYDPLDEKIY